MDTFSGLVSNIKPPGAFRDLMLTALGFTFLLSLSLFSRFDLFHRDILDNFEGLGGGIAAVIVSFVTGKFLRISGDLFFGMYFFIFGKKNKWEVTKSLFRTHFEPQSVENRIGHWKRQIKASIFLQNNALLEADRERHLLHGWFVQITFIALLCGIFLMSKWLIIPTLIMFFINLNEIHEWSFFHNALQKIAEESGEVIPPIRR